MYRAPEERPTSTVNLNDDGVRPSETANDTQLFSGFANFNGLTGEVFEGETNRKSIAFSIRWNDGRPAATPDSSTMTVAYAV